MIYFRTDKRNIKNICEINIYYNWKEKNIICRHIYGKIVANVIIFAKLL